ncbi:MAG: hypothetical protein KDA87_05045 [Planctomycetales bacterium]|nr:hypothetical protein [Planctomycetales bacterium]
MSNVAWGADALLETLATKGDLSLKGVTLQQAAFTISEEWGVNIVLGKDVTGTVNGVFRDCPLSEILDAILVAQGYGYRRQGNSLVVMRLEDVAAQNPGFVSEMIDLPSGRMEEVLGSLKSLASPQGMIQPIPSLNRLHVVDHADVVSQIKQLIQTLAFSTSTQTANVSSQTPAGSNGPSPQSVNVVRYSPQYLDVVQLETTLKDILGEQGRVTAMAGENKLLVIGDEQTQSLVGNLLEKIDLPRPQVRITAYIYDINLKETEELGVNWSQQLKGNALNAAGLPNQSVDLNGGLFPAFNAFEVANGMEVITDATEAVATQSPHQLAIKTLSRNFDLHGVVRALDETKGARLLADPSVTVVDREEASIRIVTRVPVQQLTQTEAGGNIGTTSFEEAGITLTVTPAISTDGTVLLRVVPQFSVLAGFQNSQPIIDTREASTVVRVHDQQTLVIGGLRQRVENETVRGVPFLKDAPYIGRLFRDHNTEVSENELIVFINPEIIIPQCVGKPREAMADSVTKDGLARIPHASTCPFIPDCRDPNCPYHHPRPRINGGSYDLGEVDVSLDQQAFSIVEPATAPGEFRLPPVPAESGVIESNQLAPPTNDVTRSQATKRSYASRSSSRQPTESQSPNRTARSSDQQTQRGSKGWLNRILR